MATMALLLRKYRSVGTVTGMCPSLVKHFITPLHVRSKNTAARQTPAEYCLDLVRKYDYENYLCSLLLPNPVRATAIAIRAFNVEVARVEEQARDATIGKMRFKFWEETVDQIYKNTPSRNPVALELHRVIGRHKLSKHYLKRLVTARAENMTISIFPNLESLEKYAENTSSSIYYLLLEASDIRNVRVDHAASHLGKAHGITNLIRSIVHNIQRRSIVVPQDLMIKYNLTMEGLLRGQSGKGLSDAVFEISSRAKLHLDKARSLHKDVPKKAKPIFLQIIAIDHYLERLRQADFDVYQPHIQKRNGLLSLKLYWNNLFSLSY